MPFYVSASKSHKRRFALCSFSNVNNRLSFLGSKQNSDHFFLFPFCYNLYSFNCLILECRTGRKFLI